ELQRAGLADISLEDFSVIAAGLDRLQHPFVVEAEPRSEIAGGTEQALNGGCAGFCHFVGIGSGHAELFGLDEAVMKPGDDVGPYLVAVARERSERLLSDRLRPLDVIGGI